MDKQRKRTPGGRLESWRLRAITSCRSLSLGKGRFEWRGIDPRPVENPERNPETAVDHRRSSRNYSSGDNASFLPKLKEILHESQKSGVRHHFQVASCLDPNLNTAAYWEHRSNTAAYAMAGPSDPSGAGLLLRFRGDVCVEDPVGEGWAVACSQSFTKRFTLIICTVALHLLTVHVFNFPTARCKKRQRLIRDQCSAFSPEGISFSESNQQGGEDPPHCWQEKASQGPPIPHRDLPRGPAGCRSPAGSWRPGWCRCPTARGRPGPAAPGSPSRRAPAPSLHRRAAPPPSSTIDCGRVGSVGGEGAGLGLPGTGWPLLSMTWQMCKAGRCSMSTAIGLQGPDEAQLSIKWKARREGPIISVSLTGRHTVDACRL